MSKKNHSPGPVPPGNRPTAGPGFNPVGDDDAAADETTPPLDQEQDPQRRLGGFEGKGEHSIQQPSRQNDGNTHIQ